MCLFNKTFCSIHIRHKGDLKRKLFNWEMTCIPIKHLCSGQLKCPKRMVQTASLGIRSRGGSRWTEMVPEVEFKLIPEQDCSRHSEEVDRIYKGRSSMSQKLVSISEHDLFQTAKDSLLWEEQRAVAEFLLPTRLCIKAFYIHCFTQSSQMYDMSALLRS